MPYAFKPFAAGSWRFCAAFATALWTVYDRFLDAFQSVIRQFTFQSWHSCINPTAHCFYNGHITELTTFRKRHPGNPSEKSNHLQSLHRSTEFRSPLPWDASCRVHIDVRTQQSFLYTTIQHHSRLTYLADRIQPHAQFIYICQVFYIYRQSLKSVFKHFVF